VADTIAPDGSEVTYLARTGRASLVEVRLPADRTSRPVRHRSVEEIWYFTGGQGRLWLRSPAGEVTVRPVQPGTAAVIPPGWAFQFQAADGDLRFLCYTSPPWPGDSEAEPAEPGGL
jgi:mannose-6-phosphate isomerase-like protein (cupin superfamily)